MTELCDRTAVELCGMLARRAVSPVELLDACLARISTVNPAVSGQSAGFVAPAVMGFIVTGTGSFDAAFAFLVAMTAMSVVVAATINTSTKRLAVRPA